MNGGLRMTTANGSRLRAPALPEECLAAHIGGVISRMAFGEDLDHHPGLRSPVPIVETTTLNSDARPVP